MTHNYKVKYSEEAFNDIKDIYSYIAQELLAPETASAQVRAIRNEINSLSFMPERYALVEWEPWHSIGLHRVPVNNYLVFYLVENDTRTVIIARILYGGRNIDDLINATQ